MVDPALLQFRLANAHYGYEVEESHTGYDADLLLRLAYCRRVLIAEVATISSRLSGDATSASLRLTAFNISYTEPYFSPYLHYIV